MHVTDYSHQQRSRSGAPKSCDRTDCRHDTGDPSQCSTHEQTTTGHSPVQWLWTREARQKLLRKEVIQPHLPVRLPCYDLVLITDPTFDGSLHKGWATGFGCYRLS